MGVVYGADSLWQWAHHGAEPGQSDFFLAQGAGWLEARWILKGRVTSAWSPGSGLPFTDMAPNWEVTLGRRGLLAPGKFFLCYSDDGGPLIIFGDQVPSHYRIVDPRTGGFCARVSARPGVSGSLGSGGRRSLYIFCDEE